MNATLFPTLEEPPINQRLLTVADVAAMPRTLPIGDVRYELDDGRLVIMAPPGNVHSIGQSNLVTKANGSALASLAARSG